MAIAPYPVNTLLSEALYTSSIVSRQFQTPSPDQMETALLKLNEILTDTNIEKDMIPYYSQYVPITFLTNQEKYFIANCVEINSVTFFYDVIRYQMNKVPRDRYFGQGRANNVTSLPFNWHYELALGGVNLFIYFFPDQTFPGQINGLFRLQSVTMNQSLTQNLATVNLGTGLITTDPFTHLATLVPGQFVINGYDFQGTYADVQALVNAVNAGPVPGLTAGFQGTQFVLNQNQNGNIQIATNGLGNPAATITFQNFSLINGTFNATYYPQGFDPFYINYLQYALADRLCTAYDFVLPPGPAKQLLKYQQMISKRSSPFDMTQSKISTLVQQNSINYAQVNLGKGWTI